MKKPEFTSSLFTLTSSFPRTAARTDLLRDVPIKPAAEEFWRNPTSKQRDATERRRDAAQRSIDAGELSIEAEERRMDAAERRVDAVDHCYRERRCAWCGEIFSPPENTVELTSSIF